MELEIKAEDVDVSCRRRCVLRLLLDGETLNELLRQFGIKCRLDGLDEPVEVAIYADDYDFTCRRDGCVVRVVLDEEETRRLRARLAIFC